MFLYLHTHMHLMTIPRGWGRSYGSKRGKVQLYVCMEMMGELSSDSETEEFEPSL